MARQASVTIDFSGMTCPAPLLGARKLLDKLEAGQTLCVISDCSGAADELETWCRYSDNSFVSATAQGDGKVAYLLRKGRSNATRPTVQATLDARGTACPEPVLRAKQRLKDMKRGEVLQLVTDCTAAVDDVPLWSRQTAVELLYAQRLAKGAHEFYLRKG